MSGRPPSRPRRSPALARGVAAGLLAAATLATPAAAPQDAAAPPARDAAQTAAPVPATGSAGALGARGASLPALPPLTPAAIEKAAPVLAAAREALGGDRLAAVKTLSGKGQTRRVRGNNLVPILFEIDVELPDKYVRRDESPAEESEPTSVGFNGGLLIQVPPPVVPPARAGTPPAGAPPPNADAVRATRLRTVKQDFVRFALGIFPHSLPFYPLTFGYAAQAKAPQGLADVLDVRGEDGFALRLFVHSESRLPIMVSWTLPPTGVIVTVPGQQPATVAPGAVVVTGPASPPATASADEKEQYAREVLALRQKAQATPVEHRIYFADYRDVDGVKLPFRFRRAIGTDTTEETTFDRFQVNPRIPPQRFAAGR